MGFGSYFDYFVPCICLSQGRSVKGTVTGTVIDGGDKSPVMQATVQILSAADSTMVTGNITDFDGNFSLSAKPGKYLLKVSFVGYKPEYKQIALTKQKMRLRWVTLN